VILLDVRAACARVPVALLPLEGGDPQPDLARCGLRDHRLHLPAGHGSEAIWNVHATDAIIPWIPLMIFAFLYGLSMDYEVFMLTRMREAYDETATRSRRSRSGSRGPASS
jgi:hypothetical protein